MADQRQELEGRVPARNAELQGAVGALRPADTRQRHHFAEVSQLTLLRRPLDLAEPLAEALAQAAARQRHREQHAEQAEANIGSEER